MIEWTCCECGHKYTDATGDPEERTCNDCLTPDETLVVQCEAQRCVYNKCKKCTRSFINIDKFVYCNEYEEEEK